MAKDFYEIVEKGTRLKAAPQRKRRGQSYRHQEEL
jgi:hypothetical protein